MSARLNPDKVLLTVTTYNQVSYTRNCLETLKNKSIKILCVDDASTDNTAKLCREYGIEMISKPERKGLTDSWNLAYDYFMKSRYECLIISNNDILFPDGTVEKLVEASALHPLVSVVSRKNEGGGWAGDFAVEKYHPISSDFADKPENRQSVQDEISRKETQFKNVYPFSGFCFAVSRKISEYEYSPGVLFNPANINIEQEQDLRTRCPQNALCLNAFVYHFKGVSFRKKIRFRIQNKIRRILGNRKYYEDRNMLSRYK